MTQPINYTLEDTKRFFIGNQFNAGKQYKKNGEVLWTSGTIEKISFNSISTIDELLQLHLDKKITMGSYPYYRIEGITTWFNKFIMIDIDDHEESNIEKIVEKYNTKSIEILEDFIEHYRIPSNCILRDFSGRGYHIWIKLIEFTTLKRAWNFKKDIEKRLLEVHEINEEIFPKQNEKTLTKFGNCCKLPLSINRKNGQFCNILDDFDLSKQGKGYKIPKWIPYHENSIQKKTINTKKQEKNVIKINVENKCFEWFLEQLKPCFRAMTSGKIKTHGKKNGHWANIQLCNSLYYLGAPLEVRIKAFEKQPKYDFIKTKYFVEKLEYGFIPEYVTNLKCKTIMRKGFCLNNIEGDCHNGN